MIIILGLKIRYKGKTPVDTIKLNHRLFGCLHKRKANCVSYIPGLLHDITYTKLYNACYFMPTRNKKDLINLLPEPYDENKAIIKFEEDLKYNVKEKIEEFCMDLDIQNFELEENEFFKKYKFKNAYEYWKDYAKDLGRIFKCKAKHRLDIVSPQETKPL